MKNFNSVLKNKLKNLLKHSYFEFQKFFLNELNITYSSEREDTLA